VLEAASHRPAHPFVDGAAQHGDAWVSHGPSPPPPCRPCSRRPPRSPCRRSPARRGAPPPDGLHVVGGMTTCTRVSRNMAPPGRRPQKNMVPASPRTPPGHRSTAARSSDGAMRNAPAARRDEESEAARFAVGARRGGGGQEGERDVSRVLTRGTTAPSECLEARELEQALAPAAEGMATCRGASVTALHRAPTTAPARCPSRETRGPRQPPG
jgi:hypothetical protein